MPRNRFVEGDARNRRAGRERGEQARGHRGREQHERAVIVGAADQPAERLRQPRADDAVVMRRSAARQPPRGVEHGRLGPGHALHHHQPQRMAGHIDAVAQRVGAEQRGARIVAEDVDQRAGVDRIDMLGVERQAFAREPIGDAGMDAAQPPDRGEQAERAALRGERSAGHRRWPARADRRA